LSSLLALPTQNRGYDNQDFIEAPPEGQKSEGWVGLFFGFGRVRNRGTVVFGGRRVRRDLRLVGGKGREIRHAHIKSFKLGDF